MYPCVPVPSVVVMSQCEAVDDEVGEGSVSDLEGSIVSPSSASAYPFCLNTSASHSAAISGQVSINNNNSVTSISNVWDFKNIHKVGDEDITS